VKREEGEGEVREVHEGEMEGEEDREGQEEEEGRHQVQEVQQGRDVEELRPQRVSSQQWQPGEGLVCLNACLWLCG
jgi:hypothetical protein